MSKLHLNELYKNITILKKLIESSKSFMSSYWTM